MLYPPTTPPEATPAVAEAPVGRVAADEFPASETTAAGGGTDPTAVLELEPVTPLTPPPWVSAFVDAAWVTCITVGVVVMALDTPVDFASLLLSFLVFLAGCRAGEDLAAIPVGIILRDK